MRRSEAKPRRAAVEAPGVKFWIALIALAAGLLVAVPASGQDESTTVPSIELSSTIDPASEKWIDSALERRRRRGCATRDHPPRHAGRARELDARDRSVDHRRADARRRLRLARWRPRGLGRSLHRRVRRCRRDGAADQHRLRQRDPVKRRGHRRDPRGEDRKRRRGVHPRARRDPRPRWRRRPARWSPRRPTSPPQRRWMPARSIWSRRARTT